MGMRQSGLPWDKPTKQFIPPIHNAWRVQIYPVCDHEKSMKMYYDNMLKEETPLSVSQHSEMLMASRCSMLACRICRLSASRNYTLSGIWEGMTTTNTLINFGVETLSNTWDGRCGSQPTPSISSLPLSIVPTVIRHLNASRPKWTLWAGGGRHRYREELDDNIVLNDV